MEHEDWLRSHVERCLEDEFEICRIAPDEDGDYRFRNGSAAYFVSILGEGAEVRVWSMVVRGVKRSAKLLTELNDINARLRFGRIYHCCGDVLLMQSLPAAAVDRATLGEVCRWIGFIADDVGPMIAAVHGGQTWFDSAHDDVGPEGRQVG